MAWTVSSDTDIKDLTFSNGEDGTVEAGATLTIDETMDGGRVDGYLGDAIGNFGTILIDGQSIRRVDYDGGTGGAPAVGESITNVGSLTGEIVKVVGDATSGYLLLRSLNQAVVDDETLGSSGTFLAVANGADRVGYLVAAFEAGNSSDNVANTGLLQSIGHADHYLLGTGDASASQTLEYYTTDYCPFVIVDDSGVQTIYLNLGGVAWTSVGTDELGNWFKQNNGDATITFGDGTNGNTLPSGAEVLVPNVHINGTNAANWPNGDPGGQEYQRWNPHCDDIDLENTNCGCGVMVKSNLAAASAPYAYTNGIALVRLHTVGVMEGIWMGRWQQPLDIDGCYCGQSDNALIGSSQDVTVVFKYGTVTGSVVKNLFCSVRSSGNNCLFQDISGVTFENLRVFSFYGTKTTTYAQDLRLDACSDLIFDELWLIGTGLISYTPCQRLEFKNLVTSGYANGSQLSACTFHPMRLNALGLRDVVIDGWRYAQHNGGDAGQTYSYSIVLGVSHNVVIKNIGTWAAPLDLDNHGDAFVYLPTASNTLLYKVYVKDCRATDGPYTSNTYAYGPFGFKFWNCGFFAVAVSAYNTGGYQFGTYFHQQEIRSMRFDTQAADNDITGVSHAGSHMGHYFFSNTEGRIYFHASKVIPDTAGQMVLTGSATQSSGIEVSLNATSDTVQWEFQWDILGVTAFANATPLLSGTNFNLTNCDVEYQLDTGSGWGSWTAATGANLSGETVAATGFKMRVRVTKIAGGTVEINSINVDTVTTEAAQRDNLYTLPGSAVTLSNVVNGSVYELYNVTQDIVEATGTAGATDTVIDAVAVNGDTLRLRVRKSSAATKYKAYEAQTVVAGGAALFFVSQVPDLVAT